MCFILCCGKFPTQSERVSVTNLVLVLVPADNRWSLLEPAYGSSCMLHQLWLPPTPPPISGTSCIQSF